MSKNVEEKDIVAEGEALCSACGSVKVLEDGQLICPHCDTEIDFFGEDDEDDTE